MSDYLKKLKELKKKAYGTSESSDSTENSSSTKKENNSSSMSVLKRLKSEIYNAPTIDNTEKTSASKLDMKGWEKYLADEKANEEAARNAPKYDLNGDGKDAWWEKAIGWLGANGGVTDTSLPTSGVTQTINALREDKSYRRPNDDWSDEQRSQFGLLYLESPTKAFDFAEETNNKNNKAKEEAKIKEIQDSATDNLGAGIGHTLGAIATAPLGLADYLNDLAMANAGRDIAPDGNVSPFEYSQAVTGGISEHLNEQGGTIDESIPIIGGKGWGDVYGLGTSIAQSMASAYTLGGAGTLVSYFGQGAAAGVDDALSRGATDQQAVLYGAASGTFEGVAEMIGIDNLFKLGSASTVKGVIKNILKQAGAEGTEEGVTSLLNNIADNIIMQDKSQFNGIVAELMANGMSEKEAIRAAWWESVEGIIFDTVAGSVSGSVSGGIHTGVKTIADNINAKKVYGDGAELVTEALDIDPNNAYAQKMQGKLDNGKHLSGGQLNRLVEANENALVSRDKTKMKSAVEARLTELGESGDVSALADIIVKKASGEKLSRSESQLLSESENGEWVADELSTDPTYKGHEEFSNWAGSLGTERINTEAYNRGEGVAIEKAGTTPVAKDPTTAKVPTEANLGAYTNANVTIEKDGEKVDVKPQKIASIEGDVMTIELEGGEVVDATEVDFGENQIGLVYQAAKDMSSRVGGFNIDTANVFVRGYNSESGITAAEYVHGFSDAYRFGKMGYPVSELANGVYTSKLTEENRKTAYNFGKAFGNDEVANKSAKIASTSAINAEKDSQKGSAKKKGKVHFDGRNVRTDLNDRQRASLDTLDVIAEAMGIDIRVFESPIVDGRRLGKNGSYNPETHEVEIDLHAGVNGNALMLFTGAHELSHHIKKVNPVGFKVFADALFEEFGKHDISVENLIRDKLKDLKKNGRLKGKTEGQAYDLAYDEVVADACEAMLVDSNAIKALSKKIYAKDKGLWQTIKDFITNLVARVKAAYKGLNPDSREANLVREMVDSSKRLQKLWVDALLEASEVSIEQTLGENGIAVDPNTESASLFSVRDVLTDADRKKVSNALAERFGVTQEEAMEWLKAETSLASLILNPKYSQYLDYTPDPNEVAIKQNSDYPQGTVDFSPICAKRREFTAVMNNILRLFPNHVFAATDLAKIRTIMQEEGMTIPCGICYVEDRRQLDTIVAQNFIDSLKLYREGSKTRPDGKPFNTNQLNGLKLIDGNDYTPSIYELVSLEGLNILKEKDPKMAEAWIKFNNARGMQSVRLLANEAEYKRQILKYNKNTVKSKNDKGGLRVYSFSDAEMFHLIDIIQVITDSATVGLSLQGYTKVNEYAKAVKDTGEKLNRSLIPKGELGYHIEDGKVVLDYDTVEGIDINHPDFFDNIDNPDVGNITIGVGDVQIRAAMVSDFVDQIIPFHTGQSDEVLGEKGISTWTNYKDFQKEKDIATGTASDHQINIYTEVLQVLEKEGTPITKRTFVEKFLQVCKENNLTPRFSQFLNTNEHGEYTYTEGYHKFLVDFKTFDQRTGDYLPQMPVKPIFDNEYITKILKDYVKSQKVKDAEIAKSMPAVVDRITKEIVEPSGNAKYSDRSSNPYDGKSLYADSEVYDYSFMVSLDPMTVKTMPPLSTVKEDGRISQERTIELGLANAESIGVKVSDGQYAVKNAYTKRDIIIGKGGLKHGLDASSMSRLRTNSRLSAIGGYIVQNAVPINGLTKENKQANGTYAMACLLNDGNGFVVAIVTVDEFSSRATNFDFVEITHSINGRFLANKEDSRSSTRELELGDKSLSTTAISEISIADFLEIVNSSHQSILSNDVLAHLGETRNPDGHYANRVLFSDRNNIGYHAGDLGKAEYYHQQGYGRGTGHFGTGTYFVGSEEKISGDSTYGKRPHHAVDFSDYNLYKIKDEEDGYKLHEQLRVIDGGLRQDFYEKALDDEFSLYPHVNVFELAEKKYKTKSNTWEEAYIPAWKDIANERGIEYQSEDEWSKENNFPTDEEYFADYYSEYLEKTVKEATEAVEEEYRRFRDTYFHLWLRFGSANTRRAMHKTILYQKEINPNGNRDYFAEKDKKADSLATVFMKALGYDGIDVRGTRLDNVEYGSVIYDIKEDTVLYSDRPTESFSNRSLLANALESTVQNDIERSKLQQYKEKIDLIDSEQQKLHDLREQIKELSFAKGARDTEAIKKLQFEANQAANRINTYDRQLLNLESTKALKGVLEREKKLAYQKAEKRGKEALAKYREKAAETQRELMTRYQESRKKGVESRNKTAMRHKIKDVVHELNDYLLKGTKEKHVPIELQKAVAEALDAVNMDTVGAEERLAEIRKKLEKDPLNPNLLESYRRILEQGARMDGKLQALKNAYDEIVNSDDPLIANSHDEVISNSIDKVIKEVGNTPLRDMSLAQLEAVYDMYRMVLTSVRNANKTFKAKKSEAISIIANRVMEEIDKLGKKRTLQTKTGDAVSKFDWNNQKPVYAFERIGSDTFTEVFNNVRAGEDTWATDMSDAQAFREEQYKKHKYDSWDFKKRYEFTSTTGKKFSLSLDQIMSLYAYAKRGDQAKDHLKYGGFVFDGLTEVKQKNKLGVTKTYQLKDATSYNLSDETLAEIISKLTPEQKAFADTMQDYLSITMGEKGNEVSLELYGVKLFKEKNYFPLKSAPQYLERAREQAMGDVKIKNKGFTKETTPKAKNPIVLTSFMDVWAGHVNEMSMYHAFTLALEDFYRVFNYKTASNDENLPTEGVIPFLENAHGGAAVTYIDQLLKDLNGGARSDPRETVAKGLMSRFKKAAVMGSLSVVVQQPTAIVRAMALVDAKYFGVAPITRGTVRAFNRKKHKALWAEVKKYAPVAIIKEMGYFDTGMGQSSVEWLKGEKTFMDKVDDFLSKAPAVADELAWISIWEAVKRETLHKHTDLNPTSEEFLKLVGDRFTEVVTKTQVYDSTLAKSSNMRSKSALMNMWTAFMAEPTTSINMLADAFRKGKKGNKKYAAKALGAVFGSVALNAALVSLVYAMRDDDEDETFEEKYLSRVTTELVDGVIPITYIPFLKDVWSIMQGFDIERADMSLINELVGAVQEVAETISKDTSDMTDEELSAHQKDVFEALWGIVDSIASLAGIPEKNIRRDTKGIINLFKTLGRDMDTTYGSLMDNIGEDLHKSTPVWNWFDGDSKADNLYDAIVSGDTAYVDRLKSGYKSDSSYESAIRKALRDNDPRIKDAAEARYKGDIAGYMKIAKEIIHEGNFKQDDVVAAINSEINDIKKKNGEVETSTSSDKVVSLYKMEDYYNALVGGSASTAYAVKIDLIETEVANGKDRDEAEASFNSKFVSHIRELYEEGDIASYKAKEMLVDYGGKSEEEASSKVQYWEFKEQYPDYDLSEEAVKKYYSDVKSTGISVAVYYDYSIQRAKAKGVDLNGDGKTDSGTVKSEVMQIINSLPISSYQKDALYYLNGWSQSTIGEAPWH